MSGVTDKTNELVNIVGQLDAAYNAVRALHSQLDAKYDEIKTAFVVGTQTAPIQTVPTAEQPAPSDQLAHY